MRTTEAEKARQLAVERRSGAEAFYGHACWMVDKDDERSAGFLNKIAALMGTSAAVLALIPLGTERIDAVQGAWKSWANLLLAIGATLFALCVAAGLVALRNMQASVPSTVDFLELWDQWRDQDAQDVAGRPLEAELVYRSLVTGLIDSREGRERSPLTTTRGLADSRAIWFTRCGLLFGGGVLSLFAVVCLLIGAPR